MLSGSQPPVTPAPWNLVPLASAGTCVCTDVYTCAHTHTYTLLKINLKDNNNKNSELNHHESIAWNQDSITVSVVHWLCSRVPRFTSLSPHFCSIEEDNVSWLHDETTGCKVHVRAEQCDSLQEVLREQRFFKNLV